MTTIPHLLYADAIPLLSTILHDLDIPITATNILHDDIDKIIDGCNIPNTGLKMNITSCNCDNIINEHNIKGIIVILDKLRCTNAVTTLLKLNIVPDPDPNITRTATINHVLFNHQLLDTYARTNLYNALCKRNIIIPAHDRIHDAIQNGLFVTNMRMISNFTVTDDDIKCCTSLTKLDISSNMSPITTLAPFAKTLHILIISTYSNVCLINDDSLSSCTEIIELDATRYSKITTCAPFAKSLKILYADMYTSRLVGCNIIEKENCGITNYGLSLCTNIEILYATDNIHISTCDPFANTLKILYAGGHCKIADDGLSLCTGILQLYASNNAGITTCEPFAHTLKILHTDYTCGITDTGLYLCTEIDELHASDHPYITTCAPFAHSLKKLDACCMYSDVTDEQSHQYISDAGLSLCTIICELNANNNPKITTCAPFAKSLKILHTTRSSGISDAGLSMCISITELHVDNNPKITTCEPFAKTLIKLCAWGDSGGICDKGLSCCTAITNLNASCNPKITTCQPFAKTLKVLDVSHWQYKHTYCGIDDAGLKMCHRIKKLCADNNRQITTCAPFASTLRTLSARGNCGICNDGLRLCNSLTSIDIDDNKKIDKNYIKSLNKNMHS